MTIPYMAIGNDELGEELGDTIVCPMCGQSHAIEYGHEILDDGTRIPSNLLAFYKCGDNVYLAGVKGRRVR